jgi:hypothetical protein
MNMHIAINTNFWKLVRPRWWTTSGTTNSQNTSQSKSAPYPLISVNQISLLKGASSHSRTPVVLMSMVMDGTPMSECDATRRRGTDGASSQDGPVNA